MSWVALLKAISQKKARLPLSQPSVGSVSATAASEAPTIHSMLIIHQRRLCSSMLWT